jgi:hypothetical protein
MSDVIRDKLVVVGQGYVGLPLAMRAVEVGFDVVGFDLDTRKIDGLAAGTSHIDDITDADVASALATGRYRPSTSTADLDRFDVAVITVPTPLREGVPDLSFITSATASRRARVGGMHGGVGVDDVSGHDRRAGGATPGGGVGLEGRRRLPRRVLARADRSGQPGVGLRPHAQGGVGAHAGVAGGGAGVLRPSGRAHRAGEQHPRRGDDQAVGEHVPPREHRVGERVGDPRTGVGDRHLGGDRGGGFEAVRLHPVLARARCRRPLPSDRPELPVVEDRAAAWHGVAVRRHGQRHQQPDAHLRGASSAARLERAPEVGQGLASPGAWVVVQEELERCPRDTGDRCDRGPARARRRGPRARRPRLPERARRAGDACGADGG